MIEKLARCLNEFRWECQSPQGLQASGETIIVLQKAFADQILAIIKEAGWKSPDEWNLLMSMLAEKEVAIRDLKAVVTMFKEAHDSTNTRCGVYNPMG